MKTKDALKDIQVYVEIPKFETYTDTDKAASVSASIKESISKLKAIKKMLPVIGKFPIAINSGKNFEVHVYKTFIDFKFNIDFVVGTLPILVNSADSDIKSLQQEKWNEMTSYERARHAVLLYLEYLVTLEKKYEEWITFLESDVQEDEDVQE